MFAAYCGSVSVNKAHHALPVDLVARIARARRCPVALGGTGNLRRRSKAGQARQRRLNIFIHLGD